MTILEQMKCEMTARNISVKLDGHSGTPKGGKFSSAFVTVFFIS